MKKCPMPNYLLILFLASQALFCLKAQEVDSFERELRALEKLMPKEEFISDSVGQKSAAPIRSDVSRDEVNQDEEAMSVLINQEAPPAKKSRRIRSR